MPIKAPRGMTSSSLLDLMPIPIPMGVIDFEAAKAALAAKKLAEGVAAKEFGGGEREGLLQLLQRLIDRDPTLPPEAHMFHDDPGHNLALSIQEFKKSPSMLTGEKVKSAVNWATQKGIITKDAGLKLLMKYRWY